MALIPFRGGEMLVGARLFCQCQRTFFRDVTLRQATLAASGWASWSWLWVLGIVAILGHALVPAKVCLMVK